MKNDRLTIRVVGKEEYVPLSSFLDVVNNTLTILDGIARDLTPDQRDRIEWRIVSVSMNSPLTMVIEGQSEEATEVTHTAIHAYTSGLRAIEESSSFAPPHFTLPRLDAARRIANVLNDGIGAVTFYEEDTPPVTPTQQFTANVSKLIPQEYAEEGSLEGTLEMITIHKQRVFAVYDRFTGKRVECRFTDENLTVARDALGHRVTIYGRIRFTREGDPKSVIVQEIEVMPSQSELPQFSDLEGLDITGGVDPAEYVRRLRDDAWRPGVLG